MRGRPRDEQRLTIAIDEGEAVKVAWRIEKFGLCYAKTVLGIPVRVSKVVSLDRASVPPRGSGWVYIIKSLAVSSGPTRYPRGGTDSVSMRPHFNDCGMSATT